DPNYLMVVSACAYVGAARTAEGYIKVGVDEVGWSCTTGIAVGCKDRPGGMKERPVAAQSREAGDGVLPETVYLISCDGCFRAELQVTVFDSGRDAVRAVFHPPEINVMVCKALPWKSLSIISLT